MCSLVCCRLDEPPLSGDPIGVLVMDVPSRTLTGYGEFVGVVRLGDVVPDDRFCQSWHYSVAHDDVAFSGVDPFAPQEPVF